VVTFLFTDIEGSTRRWEADADGMRQALAAHDEVLRSTIKAHHGWLFKHTGDGVCAAFASPRSAVDAAVAAHRALEAGLARHRHVPEASLVVGHPNEGVLSLSRLVAERRPQAGDQRNFGGRRRRTGSHRWSTC
jgi:class 3 adenylate cyclase